MRRAGFGGSQSEVQAAAKAGMHEAVDRLVNFVADDMPQQPAIDISYPLGMADAKQRRRAVIATQLWWLNRLLLTPNPLQERMVYFWSNHFTSALIAGGITPAMLVQQYALFRKHALGNYAQLTHEISRDPAMLLYLNGAQNRKAHPNENYARELMELFTLGVGNYSEEDVRQAARAFTGYTVNRLDGSAVFRPRLHDDGVKTILGRSGNFGADDVVNVIMQQPATAVFMARKFLRNFVYDDPEPELTSLLGAHFRAHNYDVRTLMGTLLRSNVFYSQRAYRALVKSPLDVVVGALKLVGASGIGPAVDGVMTRMGQTVMYPPNVAGWPGGSQWLSQSTLLARLNFLNQLAYYRESLAGRNSSGMLAAAQVNSGYGTTLMAQAQADTRAAGHGGIASPLALISGAKIDDPADVTQHVLEAVLQGDATAQQRSTLLRYLQTDDVGNFVPLNAENIDEKVRGATSLAFAMPSYQLM